MPNTINLNAEIGANYIGDDAQPSLTITNNSTGPGLQVDDLVISGSGGATISGNAAGTPVLNISKSVIGAPTVGTIQIQTSGASIPIFQFQGSALASLSTIKFTTGGVAGTFGLRVTDAAGVVLGWIPVMPDASVTAVAI